MAKADDLKEGMSNEEFQRSLEYNRALIEAALDTLVTIGPDGRITDVNEATVKVTGVSREKLFGTKFSDYFTEPARAEAGYKRVLKEGEVRNYPLAIRHKDGHVTDVSYNASVYKDKKGNILGVFAAARDITKESMEGAEELLNEWMYSLTDLYLSSIEGHNIFREVEKDAAVHWFKTTVGELPKAGTAYEAAVKFRLIADERKVLKKENFNLEQKEDLIIGTFLSHMCPYRQCCITRRKEGRKFVCFRATPFVVAIELMSGKSYKAEVLYEQTQPGQVCVLRGMPTQMAFKVGLSYKLKKGSVKIHEVDCQKIGVDIIDNVTIRPSRKELENRKLTLMSYSQTKYPAGMILMSIADARTLGLGERDTVYVTKAGSGEEAALVSAESYDVGEGTYEGDYSIPGLEVPSLEDKKAEEPAQAIPDKPKETEEVKKEPKKQKKEAEKQKQKEDFETKIEELRRTQK